MLSQETEDKIQKKYKQLAPYLNESSLRIWAAAEAVSYGHGGISSAARATGLSRTTIHTGIEELEKAESGEVSTSLTNSQRIRRPGGGRKSLAQKQPDLLGDLESLVDPETRGDPQSPLRWTSKSTNKLAKQLQEMGYQLTPRSVGNLLRELGYSLQSNRKTQEGKQNPDRDAQFQQIADTVKEFQQHHQPVISVDAKKKELIGNYHNQGKEWQPKRKPAEVKVHDFVDKQLGKVIPYGVYDLSQNQGWVSVGIDHNTAEFAVSSIRRWWLEMGKAVYSDAQELLITADCGSSNSYRGRLWKWELQKLANELDLTLQVCHFPPGTSKWNKIEHRLFSQITQNWRGKPLVSREVVVNLIANTTTTTGLEVKAALDENQYPTGIKVSDQQFDSIEIERELFHGEWNYKIFPSSFS